MLLNLLLRDEPSGVIINEANWSIRGSQLFIQQTVCVKVSASINNSEGVGVIEDAASVLDKSVSEDRRWMCSQEY